MAKPMALELFASDESLAELEAGCAVEPVAADAAMALAWALRQRDPPRCLSLARLAVEADAALRPRLWLIEGERAVAEGHVDDAQAFCTRAQAAFEASRDRAGAADALLLSQIIASERSAVADLVELGRQALAAAEAADDARRRAYFQVSLARQFIVSQGLEAEPLCLPLLPPEGQALLHPAVAAQLAMYRGMRLMRLGDHPGALERFAEVHRFALASGQGRLAVMAANNLALVYDTVDDPAHALEWGQAMLGLARRIWPALLSHSLCTTATLLRRLGQRQEARELVQECLQREIGRPNSRASITALAELGVIELASTQLERALAHFEQVLGHAALWPNQRFETLLDRTDALLRLGRHAQAEASANESLRMQGVASISALMLRARAQLADAWLGQGKAEQAQAAYAAILADGAALPDFKPLVSVLEGAALAHAAVGRHAEAFALSRRAAAVQESRQSHLADQRSRALYAQFRTERHQLEAEHLHRLAEASVERLEVLERSHAVLDQLGIIGRELTAQLDAGRALRVLAEHVRNLLPVDLLMVYLLDAGGQQLACALCEEQGRSVPAPMLALDSAESLVARCAREREALVLQDEGSQAQGIPLPGVSPKRSVMLAPLNSGARLVGVMSVQSDELEAFGPESQLIFATLCAYAAIALDNAQAYQRLSQMQRQLRAQERMVSLGSLVAGVAHELNTPLGNALLAVSTLNERSTGFERQLHQGGLRRTDWQQHAEAMHTGLGLVQGNIDAALRLVDNFRQVAQRRDTQQRRSFALAALCGQSLVVRSAQAQRSGHRIEIEVPAALELNSYAYAVDQALDILIGNALQHGLSAERPGHVWLRAQKVADGHCRIEVIDDGQGMSREVLERVFEPFFTTTFGRGGNGLGLSICHTLVEDVLGGHIEAFSEAGRGSRFVMELPLSAP